MARPGLRNHPKFRRFAHMASLAPVYAQAHLQAMWDVGYEHGNSRLGDPTDVELCAEWGGEPGKLFSALRDCGFIDEVDGEWHIHDLLDHAPEYVQLRARKEAERKKDKTCQCCGTQFRSTETHAKFCSSACRQSNYRESVTRVTESNGVCNAHVTQRDEPPAPAPAPAPKKEKAANAAIPPSLRVESFESAWGEWLQHLREKRKSPTPSSAKKQLVKCERWGVSRAVRAIHFSIANNWQGIFEEKHSPTELRAKAQAATQANVAEHRRKEGEMSLAFDGFSMQPDLPAAQYPRNTTDVEKVKQLRALERSPPVPADS